MNESLSRAVSAIVRRYASRVAAASWQPRRRVSQKRWPKANGPGPIVSPHDDTNSIQAMTVTNVPRDERARHVLKALCSGHIGSCASWVHDSDVKIVDVRASRAGTNKRSYFPEERIRLVLVQRLLCMMASLAVELVW